MATSMKSVRCTNLSEGGGIYSHFDGGSGYLLPIEKSGTSRRVRERGGSASRVLEQPQSFSDSTREWGLWVCPFTLSLFPSPQCNNINYHGFWERTLYYTIYRHGICIYMAYLFNTSASHFISFNSRQQTLFCLIYLNSAMLLFHTTQDPQGDER